MGRTTVNSNCNISVLFRYEVPNPLNYLVSNPCQFIIGMFESESVGTSNTTSLVLMEHYYSCENDEVHQ